MRLLAWAVNILFLMALGPGQGHGDTVLPHEFDSLVPVYEPARPMATRYTRESVTVGFSTPDAFERVAAFYAKALGKSDWKVSTSNTEKKLTAAKGRIHLTLTENADTGGFTINLLYPGGRE